MEYVNPIKKIEKIQAMKKVLRQSSLRDLLLFVIGINTGIKVHDLLYLTVKDVWDGSQTREFLYLKDEKNGEVKAYYLNSKVREVLRDYLASNQLQPDDFLFKSKKK